MTTKYDFTFIDLFAGIGGFRLALDNLNGKCLFTSEWDLNAQITYKANFNETPYGDITSDEVRAKIPPHFDILCAGFPCQAFSLAGRQRGFEDTRGTLFFDVADIAKKHRPKVLFLENVRNLIAHDKGRTFEVILNTLTHDLGYIVYYKVLNTKDYTNIAQNRERVFIVAFDPNQVKNHKDFHFPPMVKRTTTILDFLEPVDNQSRYYDETHPYYSELKKNMTNPNTSYLWRRGELRENKSNCSFTFTAAMGTGGNNVPLVIDNGYRRLGVRECFNLQGFPKSFILPNLCSSKLYKQIGNSVTTVLVQKIAQNIKDVITQKPSNP